MARIRNRIALLFSGLLFIILFAGGLMSLQTLEQTDLSQAERSLSSASSWLSQSWRQMLALELKDSSLAGSETYVPPAGTPTMALLAQSFVRSSASTLHDVVYIYSNGDVIASANDAGSVLPPVLWASGYVPTSAGGSLMNGSVDGQNMTFTVTPILSPAGQSWRLIVGTPLSQQYIGILNHWKTIAAELFGLWLIGCFAAFWIARRMSAPLEHITAITQQISAGNFRRRVPYWGQDEYGAISSSINALTTTLLDQMDDLSQEKSKVQSIISNMASGVLMVDASGVILVENEAALQILQTPHHTLIGRSHWEATLSLRMSELIDTVLLKGVPSRKEMSFISGSETHIDILVSPIFGREQETVGAVIVLHDVSQFRKMERMRSEFVANVSHELRTPITAIRGFSETLLDGAVEDKALAEQFIQIIYNESVRMSQLVVDLLELSKIESGHSVFRYSPHDVNELVSQSVLRLESQAEQAGLTLSFHPSPDEVVAELAPERIEQVLVNLITNALAYTPAPGRVDVSVRSEASSVVIDVTDTGIGIPAGDIPRIFERFYRVDKDRSRKTGGTGLGLAIVKHIVEAHQGKIQVQSTVGMGTSFIVRIPKNASKKIL